MKKSYKLALLLCFLVLFASCSKDPEAPIASINLIEQEPGFKIDNEKVSVLFRGIVDYKGKIKGVTLKIWTDENQSDPDCYTMNQVDDSLLLWVNNLYPDTEYSYGYYINYGVPPDYAVEPKTIVTPSLLEPEVTLPTVVTEDITTLGVRGNVISDGGAPIIERGICYGKQQYPDISGTHISAPIPDGVDGMGSFLVILNPNESGVYYVCAYAMNSAGLVGYGEPLILVAK